MSMQHEQVLENEVLFEAMGRYFAGRDIAPAYLPSEVSELGGRGIPAVPASLEELVTEYPELRDQLIQFAAAHFVLLETELDPVIGDEIEYYDLTFERGILAAAFANPDRGWHNLDEYLDTFGFSLDGLAAELGVGMNIMYGLTKGGIATSSLPARFIERLSDLLGTDTATLRTILRTESPSSSDDWNHSFADAIRFTEDMTPEQKRVWLKEVE
jgi:hypothetical protein